MRIEKSILCNLINKENYIRKVSPFLKLEYFEDRAEKILLQEILKFFSKFNTLPNSKILNIELANRNDITDN